MNELQLAEYSRHLRKIQVINEDISRQLLGSVVYLLKYCEKYNIKLPKKDQLESILLNTKPLLESHNRALVQLQQTKEILDGDDPSNRDLTGEKNHRRPNSILNQHI